ncbi:MAG: biotin--[acetyl-CoA-carboxylase] ligase [Deferrisomatales bacterium]|nr:biotin--[acetyl-CoA-carboxylase] ligase [Deferrisomatales bacterium]
MVPTLADEILRRLVEAGGTPVSGQHLAARMGVTRAAVWKGVESLRGHGYPVESLPARGYRLTQQGSGLRPGELAATLRTRRLGRPARHCSSVDSTNREAERWAGAGAPEGALVLAERQTAGRGRLGRTWADLPGRSLLFSLLLRPPLPAAQTPPLTFAAAVALAEALARWVPPQALELKWPNDVLLGGRKVAGILLEMRAEGQRTEHVILGVGVNVEGDPAEYPTAIRDLCTTVAAWTCPPPRRSEVLCAFLEAFESAYEDFLQTGLEALLPRWHRWFRLQGQAVRVQTPGGTVEGRAVGLGPTGSLLVDTGKGAPVREIFAGDVERSTTRVP